MISEIERRMVDVIEQASKCQTAQCPEEINWCAWLFLNKQNVNEKIMEE